MWKAREERIDSLLHRVKTLHVVRGVGFGVTELLRLFQSGGIILVLLRHLRQDIIGGAVDNSHHFGNTIRLHAVEQGTDNWNPAHTAGFEVQPAAISPSRAFQFVRIFTDKFLIGRDDALSLVQSRKNIVLCRLHAARYIL